MISVSDRQLRVVAAAADLLPVEVRGTFLRRVVVELRGRRDFSDCDIEQGGARGAARSVSGTICLRTRLRGARRTWQQSVGRPYMPRAGPRHPPRLVLGKQLGRRAWQGVLEDDCRFS
jgi:hypothetical protein